ncbi:rRNA-processing protein FCF1 homolog [Oppia nitens]|uniref:rRNA-processing protein FCF1 homolog n=1 Tax=Oppia nitens TaxID=1686743 RepID=UPI0023DB8D35|nr:rRNA-processing protein FCF1 homolog [Oppia nitens]
MAKEMKVKTPKLLSLKDSRIKNLKNEVKLKKKNKKTIKKRQEDRVVATTSTTMFFNYNQSLGPPFRVICDTNFVNFSIKNKLDIRQAMTDCLLSKCIPFVTDCVVAELQKLGAKYRLALRIVKEQMERLPCSHSGTYADDCLVHRVSQHKCYIIATADRALKRRIRKIPGIPIMYIKDRHYYIERMPDAYGIRT